jgi:hypothetical protein
MMFSPYNNQKRKTPWQQLQNHIGRSYEIATLILLNPKTENLKA